MSSQADFTRHVPGFDFLQGLMKNAGAGLPAVGQWIAPTLDPDELDKRIQELKTVQFWLEQNARLLATTIQALEVQRMTLATLRGMNMPMADLTESLKIRPWAAAPAAAPAPAPASASASAPAPAAKTAARSSGKAKGAAEPTPGLVDPVQWWGALTQQFTDLASQALKDSAKAAAAVPGASSATFSTASPAAKPSPAKPRAKPRRR